jgi:D-psicose/D-tagatose/L-ribulose 3-epimerase
MTFGINLFLWTTSMSEKKMLRSVLPFLKKTGYDFVEIPVSHANLADWKQWQNILDNEGLERVTCSICGPEYSLISSSKKIRQAGIDRIKSVLDASATVGSALLTGPYHSGFCEFTGKPATDTNWKHGVEAMQEIAVHAQQNNIMLGVEYLNRFENYFLTSTDELIRYVEAVDHPNCRLMYDTFHAHIEEKNQPEAIKSCSKYLAHVQFSENDRSTLGSGQIDFHSIMETLKTVGYDGTISVEAFGLTPKDLAAGAHIYRPMFESPTQLAQDSLAYIKSL